MEAFYEMFNYFSSKNPIFTIFNDIAIMFPIKFSITFQ